MDHKSINDSSAIQYWNLWSDFVKIQHHGINTGSVYRLDVTAQCFFVELLDLLVLKLSKHFNRAALKYCNGANKKSLAVNYRNLH